MRPDTERIYRERILRVLVHIQQHLDEPLALEDLARVAHFSPFHFHRIFRGMVGEGVKEHVRRLRLERAAQRLKAGDDDITRIAFEAGYETHEAFSKAFRSHFAESPSGFRKQKRSASPGSTAVPYVPDGELTGFQPVEHPEPDYPVRLEPVPPMKIAFIRHTGPYSLVGDTWQRLMAWTGSRNLIGPFMTVLGVAYDDPEVTPEDKIRYDAGLVIHVDVEPEGEVGVQDVAGGEYAITLHRGPYDTLSRTYARLCGGWLPAKGREPEAGPCLEIYRNSPLDTAPADLLTEVYVPLKPV